MTTGTMLLMWLGEQITDRGIGNGVSLIITVEHSGAPAAGGHGTSRTCFSPPAAARTTPTIGTGIVMMLFCWSA